MSGKHGEIICQELPSKCRHRVLGYKVGLLPAADRRRLPAAAATPSRPGKSTGSPPAQGVRGRWQCWGTQQALCSNMAGVGWRAPCSGHAPAALAPTTTCTSTPTTYLSPSPRLKLAELASCAARAPSSKPRTRPGSADGPICIGCKRGGGCCSLSFPHRVAEERQQAVRALPTAQSALIMGLPSPDPNS